MSAASRERLSKRRRNGKLVISLGFVQIAGVPTSIPLYIIYSWIFQCHSRAVGCGARCRMQMESTFNGYFGMIRGERSLEREILAKYCLRCTRRDRMKARSQLQPSTSSTWSLSTHVFKHTIHYSVIKARERKRHCKRLDSKSQQVSDALQKWWGQLDLEKDDGLCCAIINFNTINVNGFLLRKKKRWKRRYIVKESDLFSHDTSSSRLSVTITKSNICRPRASDDKHLWSQSWL